MYIFCKIMLILSILGVFANLVLIYVNKGSDINDLLRALLLLVSAVSFYTLMRFYKRKRKR